MKILEGKQDAYDKYVAANSDDDYSRGIVQYSEAWANLMEKKMAVGEKLEDIADDASHKVDTEGITGFMYGCAAQGLAEFWEYGEQLRHWHNLKTQIGTEGEKANKSGGVLNPAIIQIGDGDGKD